MRDWVWSMGLTYTVDDGLGSALVSGARINTSSWRPEYKVVGLQLGSADQLWVVVLSDCQTFGWWISAYTRSCQWDRPGSAPPLSRSARGSTGPRAWAW